MGVSKIAPGSFDDPINAQVIQAKMREANWNKTTAARILSVGWQTIPHAFTQLYFCRPNGLRCSCSGAKKSFGPNCRQGSCRFDVRHDLRHAHADNRLRVRQAVL